MNPRHAVVSHGADWLQIASSAHLSGPRVGGLAGSPKTVVVRGQAPDKAGGKTHNADKVICIDLAALGTWRNRHDPERQFFGPDYHPGNYVFTLVTDALRIRTRSDSGSTVSPRRLRSRAFPSMALRHPHATGQRRPESWRESDNHLRAHRAKTPTLPGSSSGQYSGRATRNPAATPGWSHNWQSSQPRGPISAKQMV